MKKLVLESYINGWRYYNSKQILAPLAEDCLIIESHGPTYHGKKMVQEWIKDWHLKGNQVEKWDIQSFYSIDNTVFLEWNFAYSNKDIREEFEGITIAKIKEGLIFYLKEYRMTAPAYEWKKS